MADNWHRISKDDAWREVTLASMIELDYDLWLRCDTCGHEIYPTVQQFAGEHGLDMETPLLIIGMSLRCSWCGEKKAGCRPKPYQSR